MGVGWVLLFCVLASLGRADRDGLEALYLDTQGQNWFAKVNWLSPAPTCSWDKVECSAGEIIGGLLLSSNNLDGTIPVELFSNLTQLERLEFQRNLLSGPLPSEIGMLSDLRIIKLQENALSEKIPSEIGLLSKLIQLSFAENEFEEIPSEIGDLSSLEVLYLYKNLLNTEIPSEIGKLSNLRALDLNSNQLVGLLPTEIGLLSKLESLSIAGNSLEGIVPSEIALLSNLKSLDLGTNEFTGTLPVQLAGLSQLTVFFLQRALGVTGTIPTEYGTMNLNQLALGITKLEGSIPSELGQLPLSTLQLYASHLSGPIPSELGQLNDLRQLDLSGNQLSGDIPVELGNLGSLRSLGLQTNNFTTIPSELGKLANLVTLDLLASELTGTIPIEFEGLSNLQALFLGDNYLSGTIPSELAKLSSLRVLILNANSLGGTIPEEFKNLESLQQIHASNNFLVGTLPDFSLLPHLDQIELRNTQLSGVLPEWICNLQRANFEGNTFDCPLPSCCGEPGIHCGGQCIPPPTPTPSPSPPTPPIPPTPSPTPSHSCTMSLSSSPGGVPGPFAVFASTQHCGAGRFEWTYTETEFRRAALIETGFLCTGKNPRGSCSGSTAEIPAGGFSANTSVTVDAKFIPSSNDRNEAVASLTKHFPALAILIFLNAGAQEDSIILRANFLNDNLFEDVSYVWTCSPENPDECPLCPGEAVYRTGEPSITLDFDPEGFQIENCEYELGVEVVFSAPSYGYSSDTATFFSWNRELPAPVVSFNPTISTCGIAVGVEGGVYFSLDSVDPPAGFEVVDVIWGQTEGDVLTCEESSDQNCGGDGNTFIFFPIQGEEACVPKEFEVTVTISDGNLVSSSTIPLCETVPLLPPSGGRCVASDDCGVPFSEIEIECSDWTIPCGVESFRFTPVKQSLGSNQRVPINVRPFSTSFIMPSVDADIEVEVCNFDLCEYHPLTVPVCEETEEQEFVEVGLTEAEEKLEEDRLDEAIQTLLSVGDSASQCDEVKVLSRLVEQYISLSVQSVEGNITNLPDTTTLMELLGVIGDKSCEVPPDLFQSLSLLCIAPTNAAVQTFALDVLLSDSLAGASSAEKINFIDEAIQINECVQSGAIEERCANALPSLYEGDAFYYSQHVATILQLHEGLVIEAPNSTLFIPPKFDEQIAYDYQKGTGDETIPYSCVAINILRTDAILSTPVPIDSAVLGVTFFVFVNGSSVRVPVGHNGRPAKDVILKLRREGVSTQQEKRKNRFVLEGAEQKQAPQCSYYVKGELITTGCVTLDYNEEFVNCSCTHFSNFGLLFGSSNEDWTTLRILSVSLFGGVWVALFVFMTLVTVSHAFRVKFHFETAVENKGRVLGARNPMNEK